MQVKYSGIGAEPFTAEEFKSYAKIDFSVEDTLIGLLITSAREQVEVFTNRALVVKIIEYFNEVVEDEILLPYPDHNAITEVKFNGVVSTGYTKTGLTQFIITPTTVNGFSTGLTADDSGVYVKYTTTGECPEAIKTEIKRLLLEQYEQRGNTFVGSIAELSENTYSNLLKYVV